MTAATNHASIGPDVTVRLRDGPAQEMLAGLPDQEGGAGGTAARAKVRTRAMCA
jgi:hypothetical protein